MNPTEKKIADMLKTGENVLEVLNSLKTLVKINKENQHLNKNEIVANVGHSIIEAINNVSAILDSFAGTKTNGYVGLFKGSIEEFEKLVDKLETTINDDGKISDGEIRNLVVGSINIVKNIANEFNPLVGTAIGIAVNAIDKFADMFEGIIGKETFITQNIIDGSLKALNKAVDVLENAGVDFSNSLINPSELPINLKELWSDISGVKNDFITGDKTDNAIFGEAGNDTLYGYAGNDILHGGTGNDKLYGGADNDFLNGGQGWDKLEGGNGNDILVGGKGHDQLIGGYGDDIYFFNKNDGLDAIHDRGLINFSKKDGGYDKIVFGSDVKLEDITFQNIAGVLSIKYGRGKDESLVSVFGHFLNDKNAIERIELTNEAGEVTHFIDKEGIDKVIENLNAYGKDNFAVVTHESIHKNDDMMAYVTAGWTQA